MTVSQVDNSPEKRRLDELAPAVRRAAGLIGLAGLLIGVAAACLSADARQRFFHAYLVSFCFFLSLSLGALFFVMLQHLTRSGWSVVVRRLAEAIAANVLPLAVLFIPLLVGIHDLYKWSNPNAAELDGALQSKCTYLNVIFFIARCILYFGVWCGVAHWFLKRSLEQDESGEASLTLRMERVSAPGMILYALTVTFAAFDLLMSLDPHWFSTIYGVYFFSGCVVGFFALLPVIAFVLQGTGRLTRSIAIEHYHDVGRLLLAFIAFWAYIGFSQYLLIWYANIPEETVWYLRRQTGSWAAASVFLVCGHFVVPFLVLVSRCAKRRPKLLVIVAVWMLAMHWFDLYWLVMPESSPGQIGLHWLDAACFVGIGGLYVAALAHRLRNRSLIPQRDPRLPESLAFDAGWH